MTTALYPGSFDPVTYGHLDIIRRAAAMCDHLYVAVLNNSSKKPLFSVEEREELIREALNDLDNVTVCSFSGLTIDFAKELGAHVIVRGLRAVTDFEYELQMAQTNRKMAPDIDTVFLTTGLEYAYLSSSITKEVARFGGDISAFVPEFVADRIRNKMNQGNEV
ncbi:MAG: pantetheine-phosphate adenylyltransferase [Lachnospiraceae bacterium]|nr:pantetheine-phosphate adenylyltransferase [Lachnospiraceae bacterium]